MKKIVSGLVIYIISTNLFGQQNAFNLENELQEFIERGGRVEQYSGNPLLTKLIFKDATAKVFYFNENKNVINDSLPTTIINVWEIDTTLYSNKFKFWQSVKIFNSFEGTIPMADNNNNGFIELYGVTRFNWPFGGQVDILEQNHLGKFQTVHSYDSTSINVLGMGDIDSDGINDIHLRTTDTLNGKFYKADSLGALPTIFDQIFYFHPIGQINNMTMNDFDNDQLSDCIFIDWPTVHIAEYDSAINNFVEVFNYSINADDVPVGFAIVDFDEDKKTEIVFGTALKKLYIIKVIGNSHYEVVWQGNAPTYNAYMLATTNDIDDNGKKEFWVGGQDFNTGISTIWCYETDGLNYYPVASIELRYLISLFGAYLQAIDIDADGQEELIINIGNYLLILNFSGSSNFHKYDIYYTKIKELTQPGSMILPIATHDFNKDGRIDILLPLDLYNLPNISYILVRDTLTEINEFRSANLEDHHLFQNNPNPFNPSTSIKFVVNKEARIIISVYNILGKEVIRLLDGQLSSGEHIVQWNGDDTNRNKLPAGVYFIRMIADSYHKTIKAVLTK